MNPECSISVHNSMGAVSSPITIKTELHERIQLRYVTNTNTMSNVDTPECDEVTRECEPVPTPAPLLLY